MTKKGIIVIGALAFMIFTNTKVYSQSQRGVLGQDEKRNVITTAVPSLLIGPDSRIGAMGETGVAVSEDINAQHWNASKYVFSENTFGLGLSFSPWLAGLGVNDIYLAYLAGYAKIGRMDAVSFSLRYFSMGEMELRGQNGELINTVSPHEFAIDAAYSRKLIDNLSMAVTGRFIYSMLSNYTNSGSQDIKPGIAGAADVSLFYTKDLRSRNVESSKISWGLSISNIGNKISYSSSLFRSFLPANFRTGVAYTVGVDKYNKLTFTFDLNKLLVPTPPLYLTDSASGAVVLDNYNNPIIAKGRNPQTTSSAEAVFTSWFDAPGGFGEEMREFIQNIGIEYGYNDLFFIRTGFFNEAWSKGNRKYITFGVGLKYSVFSIDACYILPINSRNHPLENTLRFSISLDFDSAKGKNNRL